MMHPTRAGIGLIRLGDSDFVSANPDDDLRGKAVYDAQGQRIGSVSDLYIDRQDREVRYLEVGAGGFLGIGEKNYLVPVEAVTEVAEDRVTIKPGRTEKVEDPSPSTPRSRPRPPTCRARTTTRLRSATLASVRQRRGNRLSTTRHPLLFAVRPLAVVTAMVFMELLRSEADRAGAYDRENHDAVWGVRGIMAKDILPDRRADRRKRSRLCALRTMDRLGLLGEKNMIPTLARRPELRWLEDEEGARWAVLTELGRIGESGAFEEAVEWALENRPSLEETSAYIRRFRLRRHRPVGTSRVGRRPEAKAGSAEPEVLTLLLTATDSMVSCFSSRGATQQSAERRLERGLQGAKPAQLVRSR